MDYQQKKVQDTYRRDNWEVVGYLSPVFMPPVAVERVLRDKNNPEVWFYLSNPDQDVRAKVMDTPARDDKGRALLGAVSFVELKTQLKYSPATLCILLSAEYLSDQSLSHIVQVTVFPEQKKDL